MGKKLTPENIQELKENQIFVFGSNMNGNHAGGAARLAVEKFGAIMGQAEGLQGQSYAIPTLDKNMEKVTEVELITSLMSFRQFAKEHPEKEFLLTAIGTGIAGFDTNYMAYMVLRAYLPDNVTIPKQFSVIKGYKGFSADMTCKGFRYEEGQDYEEQGDIEICKKGFHFCIHPLDVFGFYPPADRPMNKFHEVEGSGDMDVDIEDTKMVCSKIHIGAELDIKSMVDTAVKVTFGKCKLPKDKFKEGCQCAASETRYQCASQVIGYQCSASATGNQGAAFASGYQGVASATGNQGAVYASGDRCASSATGCQGAASASGYRCVASVTGNLGAASATCALCAASATGDQCAASAVGRLCAASATGEQSAAFASGNRCVASATGEQGASFASGNRCVASATGFSGAAFASGDLCVSSVTGTKSVASATGKDGIALAAGKDCKAKGALGCWIVLTERGEWDGETYPIISVKAFKVDGEKIKEDTWYMLVDGEAKEVED